MAECGRGGRGRSAGRRQGGTAASLSPEPSRCGTTYVVTKIVHDIGDAQYPVLTRSNYAEWEVVVKVMMKACGLWKAISIGSDTEQEDQMAMEAILKAVPPEFAVMLGSKDTAKEAWEALKNMRLSNDRVRKAKAQQPHREYEALTFCDGEAVEDFALRLTSMVSQFVTLGDVISKEVAVSKYLRSVPSRFAQITMSIETSMDMDKLTIEDVAGRLKAVLTVVTRNL